VRLPRLQRRSERDHGLGHWAGVARRAVAVGQKLSDSWPGVCAAGQVLRGTRESGLRLEVTQQPLFNGRSV